MTGIVETQGISNNDATQEHPATEFFFCCKKKRRTKRTSTLSLAMCWYVVFEAQPSLAEKKLLFFGLVFMRFT